MNDWDLVKGVKHDYNEISVSRDFIKSLKHMSLNEAKKKIKPYFDKQGKDYVYRLKDNQKEDVIIKKQTLVYNDFSLYNALK